MVERRAERDTTDPSRAAAELGNPLVVPEEMTTACESLSPSCLSLRYTFVRSLPAGASTGVHRMIDECSGCAVIAKTAPLQFAIREAECLLQLPRGTGPRLLDLVWAGSGQLFLILEPIEGHTLRDTAGALHESDLPFVIERVAERLVHLHRVGWTHADLHPGNIIAPSLDTGQRAMLLDFGFSIRRGAPVRVEERGGALPYLAPEVVRGWIVDGRADLYAVGVGVAEMFPSVVNDARWRPILDRLRDPVPAGRYESAAALRDELVRVFDLTPDRDDLPGFPSGPTQGRTALQETVLDRIRSAAGCRILVQGRPATGLTRFMNELALSCARAGLPGVIALDLSGCASPARAARAIEGVERIAGSSDTVVVAVPDPSPALRWVAPEIRTRLDAMTATGPWYRVQLPPLDPQDYVEAAVASLGRRGGGVDLFARTLHSRTEGDLRAAAEEFQDFFRSTGDDPGQPIGDAAIQRWDAARGRSSSLAPTMASVPRNLRLALRACARIGASFPVVLAEGVLARLDATDKLAELEATGYLLRSNDRRSSFVTVNLWREARRRPGGLPIQEIDRWIADLWDPDLDYTDDVLSACRIFRKTGQLDKERKALGDGLDRANSRRLWSEVARYLAYPDLPPAKWTLPVARSRMRRLAGMLAPEWTESRLLPVMGTSLKAVDIDVGLALLNDAAAGKDPRAAYEALVLLIDRVADRPGDPDIERYMAAMERLSRIPGTVPRGVLEFFAARQSLAAGRADEAFSHADRARSLLAGSGLVFEAVNLQTLGAIRFDDDPEDAIGSWTAALETTSEPEMDTTIRHNLSIAYSYRGRPDLALDVTEEGLRRHASTGTPRLIALRIQRYANLVQLDRIEAALEEFHALVRHPSVQKSPSYLATVRMLLGFIYLHRGRHREALGEAGEAWAQSSAGAPVFVQAECLRYLIDALIDLELWGIARDYAPDFRQSGAAGHPVIAMTQSRAGALVAQAHDRIADADRILQDALPIARSIPICHDRARFLHQLGRVRTARSAMEGSAASAQDAVALFEEEISLYASSGERYRRARAHLAMARALTHVGAPDAALQALTTASALARDAECKALLESCLRESARIRMDLL